MKKIDKFIIKILLTICEILSGYSEKVYSHKITFLITELKELEVNNE